MKKQILLLSICLTLFNPSKAQIQEKKEEKPVEIKWSGFIMNNFFYDSRKMFSALDGLVTILPLPEDFDNNGSDMNAAPSASFLSLASRLRAGISGPNALGAVTTGYMELDFTARANAATVRFRQAWINFNWGNTSLLLGRTWNPFVSTDVLPEVVAMNIGIPFQPFNRSDQITLTHKTGNLYLIASASYQNDYVNNGPVGRTPAYQNNAILPNLHAQVKYKSENTILGLGADYKRLKPKEFTISPENQQKYKSEYTLGCPAIVAFAQLKSNMLTVRAKSILAANASENLMTGAFGISSIDQQTGNEQYSPYKHWFLWTDIRYGKKVRGGVMGGYLRNLGATDNLIAPNANLPLTVFGLGEKISEMYRVSPSIAITSGKVMIACELEHSIAAYGDIDYGNNGKIINSRNISSTRLLGTIYYYF
jgi:hypothetical protein